MTEQSLAPSPTRVLFVDDDPGYLRAVRRLLRPGGGIELLVASDGDTARRIVDDNPPAMIILDVYMPDLDGIEYCRRLKGDRRTQASVVVVVSAAMTAGLEHAARDAGATRALDKVADLDQLFQLIRNHTSSSTDGTPSTTPALSPSAERAAVGMAPVDLADHLARQLAQACGAWIDVAAATSAGRRGLDLAAATFEPSQRIAFATWVRRHVRAEILDDVAAAVRRTQPADAAPDEAIDQVERAHVLALLHQTPQAMPFTTGLIIVMRYERGFSFAEIAVMLQLPIEQVRELCERGRGLLRPS